jgi:hypothetical protein
MRPDRIWNLGCDVLKDEVIGKPKKIGEKEDHSQNGPIKRGLAFPLPSPAATWQMTPPKGLKLASANARVHTQ